MLRPQLMRNVARRRPYLFHSRMLDAPPALSSCDQGLSDCSSDLSPPNAYARGSEVDDWLQAEREIPGQSRPGGAKKRPT